MWITEPDFTVDKMVKDLVSGVQECVEKTATMRIQLHNTADHGSTVHTVSARFKELWKLKKKRRLRRSPANVARYKKFLDETTAMVREAERS